MKRMFAAPMAVAIAILLALPASGAARVEVRGAPEASCSLGLGVTLRLCIDRGELVGGLELSGLSGGGYLPLSSGGLRAGILGVSVGAADVAAWGLPIVLAIIGAASLNLNRV